MPKPICKITYLAVAFLSLMLSFMSAQAVCPVCAIVIGAGVGLTRWLGIDDAITGLWIGGLLVSLIAWTIDWCNRKKIRFYGRKILIVILYYGITIVPLYYMKIMGNPLNKLWGMDKLLLGTIVGSIVFLATTISYNQMKKQNQGRAYFPLQKVVMPVAALLIFSGIFYFIVR